MISVKRLDTSADGDEIHIPISTGYRMYPLMLLMGDFTRRLKGTSGFGMAPHHFITQRGPQQDGVSVLDMRWDGRTIQILADWTMSSLSQYYDVRNRLIDLFRPNRAFSGTVVTPHIYRKRYPAGKIERGTDGQLTNGEATIISLSAAFVSVGNLEAGDGITLVGVDYRISSVPNDYTVILTTNYAGGTVTNGAWQYRRNRAYRDLFCLCEFGPDFVTAVDQANLYPYGVREAIRFVAFDPFWHGREQTEDWILPDNIGDLTFDGESAWFGYDDIEGARPPPDGRWLFAPTGIGEAVAIVYLGTYRARPIITVDGPASLISVTNNTTGKQIVVNYDIILGETITINTQTLTVTLQDETSLLSFTSGDLATFGLEPDPTAPDGINSVVVSFSGATTDSEAVITWQNLYAGI